MKRILPIEIILSQSSANSGTYGFSAGITLDLKGNKKQTNTSTTTSLASNLTSNNLIINTSDNKDTTIQGSNVNVSNNALINTNNLNLLASEDTYTQDMKNKSVNASITIGMGGLSGDLGLGKDKTNTNKLNHNNTQLNVYNNLDLNINNDLNIKGANVLVKGKTSANIKGDLNIVSLRDIEKTTSSSTSIGMSAGESGLSGASGGISVSKSTNKTVLISSFVTNESDIKVKGNTHLEGSVLASGTIDSNGNLIDNNSLNLETKTITYKDLSNIKYEKSSSTDIGIGQTLSLDYKAGLNIEKTKTLSTLGNGNITLTGKDKQIDERLNRDVNNTKKELYKVDQTKGVDLTVDVRMLTEDGRKEIKKDMTVAYDHGTDFVEAAKQISEDDNLNVLNYVDQVKNNIATTKVKEHLKYTNDGQDILKALESNKNSQEYQEAEVKAGNLYQKFRGIEETKIIHFDAKTTDKLELADINSNGLQVNVEGATITKGENKGDIFLDVSGDSNGLSSKANSTIVLGHELGETQYLENGNGIVFEDSYDTKEAMNNTLGDRYLSRLNEASNGVLTNTTTTYTPNNYVNSGTIYSNSVQIKENGIEFRKLALIEKDFINKNASMFASQNSFTPFLSKTGAQPMKLSKAHKILTEAANYLVDKSSNNKTKYRLESVVNPGDVTRKELQKGIEFLQKQSEGLTINYSPLGKEDNQKAFTAKPDHYIISGLDLDKNTPVQTSLLGGIEVIVTGGPAAKIFIKSGAKTLPKLLKKVDELDNKFGIYLSIKKDNLPSNKFNNLFSKQVDYNTIDSSLPHGTPDPSIAGGIGFGGVQIYEFIKSIFSDQENKKNKE